MDIKLTKDADKMLRGIYKAYKRRRKAGISKNQAVSFMDEAKWPKKFAANWQTSDARHARAELGRMGLIKNGFDGKFLLTDKGIAYAETAATKTVGGVVGYILNLAKDVFLSCLPFHR